MLQQKRSAAAEAGQRAKGELDMNEKQLRYIVAIADTGSIQNAARALGNPAPEGDLVWCDGVYWLSLPADAERAACLLSEFTGPADSSPFLSSRLGEHGSTLLTGEALAVLLHYFPEKME